MQEPITLARDDVEAMRRASTLVFFADSEGRAKVRAILERRHDENLTDVERRIFPKLRHAYTLYREMEREFPVNGNARTSSGISGEPSPLDGKRLIGSYVGLSARHNGQLRTISSIAREGQQMELLFLADYSTHNNLRKVDYHADDFVLKLHEVLEGRRVKTYEFLVDVYVGPHDSARMVRAENDVAQLTTNFSIDNFWEDDGHALRSR